MITLLSIISITSIWVLGLTIATQEGMILYSIREWGDKIHSKGNKWIEPIILCHWCMPSLHSIVGYAFAYKIGVIDFVSWQIVFMYPLVVMGSSMLNGLVWGIHKLIENKSSYYEHVENIERMEGKH